MGSYTPPFLASYSNPFEQSQSRQNSSYFGRPPLWETVTGSNGYYPLALLARCSTDPDHGNFQPSIGTNGIEIKSRCDPVSRSSPHLPMYPSLLWNALCVAISMLCIFHLIVMWTADYWSPFTRDMSIQDNVEPERRCMYVRIGTAMLFSIAFIVTFPIIPTEMYLLRRSGIDVAYATITISTAFAAAAITFYKTWGRLKWRQAIIPVKSVEEAESRWRNNLCYTVSLLAFVALMGIPASWIYLCLRWKPAGPNGPTYAGVMFAYRCLHPESGVSPVVPVLLLLFGWYLWAVCQTWRLRFSMQSRPILPGEFSPPKRFYVSDEELKRCCIETTDCSETESPGNRANARNSCLYSNITCILITRQILRRFWRTSRKTPDLTLVSIYICILILFLIFPPMYSLEGLVRFTHFPGLSETFDGLVVLLFFPLLFISLSGWLRAILVWGSLRRSLLERLENQPLRFAFSQLQETGWISMIRQGGLREWWRDMARSSESMRQLLNDDELKRHIKESTPIDEPHNESALDNENTHWNRMKAANQAFEKNAEVLRSRARGDDANTLDDRLPDFEIMHDIEKNFGAFAQALLAGALIPYWENKTCSLVASALINQDRLPGNNSGR